MEPRKTKILMCFDLVRGKWHVFFRTAPRPHIYPRRFVFADSFKIRDLFLRYGASKLSEDCEAFDYAVEHGKGIIDLLLGEDQIAVLENKKAPPGRVRPETTRRLG